MTLAAQLESKFRGDIRHRGFAYLKAERVAITRVTADEVFASVRDGTDFQTHLSREDGQLRMFCNCASEKQADVTCKHLWATVLAVDESHILTAAPKPGYFPPFISERSVDLFEDVWDEDGPDDDHAMPRLRSQTEVTTPAVPALPAWQAALKKLKENLEHEKGTAKISGRERSVFYEIDIEQCRAMNRLVVQTSQRQRRLNGQWGKLKPLRLRPNQLDELENSEDRRILSYLSGGTPERSNWYNQQAEIQTQVFRYILPQGLCDLILPMMCATGRVRYLDSSLRDGQSLEWDAGPAWELTAKVQLDDETQEWQLVGELRRDDECLDIDSVELLIPGGLVATNSKIARLNDFGAFAWTTLFKQEDATTVPMGQEDHLVDQLLDMPTMPRLELPEELQLEEVHAEPKLHLLVRVPTGNRWHRDRLFGEVQFDYLGTKILASNPQWAVVQRSQGRCIVRDHKREEAAWEQLQDFGFRHLTDQRRGGNDVEIAARDLGHAVTGLIAQGWEIHADGKRVHQPKSLKFRVETNIDWFELTADIDFDGRSIAYPELLSAVARGDTTVRLDDGSLGILPDEWIQQFGLLGGVGVAEEDHLRFRRDQVPLLDALLSGRDAVDYDEKYLEFRSRFEAATLKAGEESSNFQGELRAYQREGLGWLQFLQDCHFGGCLADDMGLGKTVQLLAMLQSRRLNNEEKLPSLVVVPKSLIFNWVHECERFTPTLSIIEYVGPERAEKRELFASSDIVLTTYGTLRRDIMLLKEVRFDYIVLDEAQTIKNAGSQVAKASRLLRANHRLALSGTPIENHLGDLWSIFEFLNPGMLGRSSLFKNFATDPSDAKSRDMLGQGLRPFILRRTKKEVANELPEKVEQTIYCELGGAQRKLYDELRDHYRDSLLGVVAERGLAKSKMHVLEALLRLRQAACHSGLLDETTLDDSSAKLDALLLHLEELLSEGHKALVFSQFTSLLSIVRRHFEKREIVYEYLDGQSRQRKQSVERFQTDDECGVFLISLKAGGLGLNLTAADYVFLLDPWWNPAVEAQAIDRAHRVGQTRRVFAYRMICRNTIEEKIAELQGQKKSLADAILQADNNLLKDMSLDDLKMLLS